MSPIRIDSNDRIIGLDNEIELNTEAQSGLTSAEQEALGNGLNGEGSNLGVGDSVQTTAQNSTTIVKARKKGGKYYVQDSNGNVYETTQKEYKKIEKNISQRGTYKISGKNMGQLRQTTGKTPFGEISPAAPKPLAEPVETVVENNLGEPTLEPENAPTETAPTETAPTESAPTEPTTNPEIEKAQQKLETTKQNHKNAYDNMRNAKNNAELNRQNLEATKKELEQIQKEKEEAKKALKEAKKALDNAKEAEDMNAAKDLLKQRKNELKNINAKYAAKVKTHNAQVKVYNQSLKYVKETIKDFSNAKNELNKAKNEVKKAQGEKVEKLKKHNAKKAIKGFKKANPKAETIPTSTMGKVGKFFKGKGGKAAVFLAIGAAVVGAIAYFSNDNSTQKAAKAQMPVNEETTVPEVANADTTAVETAPVDTTVTATPEAEATETSPAPVEAETDAPEEAPTEEAPATETTPAPTDTTATEAATTPAPADTTATAPAVTPAPADTTATEAATTPAPADTTATEAATTPVTPEAEATETETNAPEEAEEIDETAVQAEIEAENAEPLYVIKAGDNVWNIVKNQLKSQNNGVTPTNSEIAKGVIKIMDDNDLHFETDGSTVKIYVNQKLKIGSLSVEG